MYKYFYVILLIGLVSCNAGSRSEKSTIILPADDKPIPKESNTDCYPDRTVVKLIQDEPGVIIQSGDVMIIDCIEAGHRLHACELPDWASVGTEVMVTGVMKNTKENERRAGTPFLIHTLKRK